MAMKKFNTNNRLKFYLPKNIYHLRMKTLLEGDISFGMNQLVNKSCVTDHCKSDQDISLRILTISIAIFLYKQVIQPK